MMRLFKKISKIFIYTSALLIVIYLSGIFFLQTSRGQKLAIHYAENTLKNTLSLNSNIGAINSNIFSYINIENLRLSSEKDTLVDLSRVNISFSLFPLFNNKLIFKEIKIDSLSAFLKHDKNGKFNLNLLNSSSNKKDTTSSPLQVLIENLIITNSKLHYDDQTIPLNIIGNNVCAAMSLHDNIFKIDANFKKTSLDYLGSTFKIDSVNLAMSITSNDIIIDTISILFPKLDLSGRLTLGLSERKLALNGNFIVKGKPYNLLKNILNVETINYLNPNEGLIISTKISGNTADLIISSTIKKINISSLPIENISFKLNLKNNILNFNEISLNLFDGEINGSGFLSLNSSNDYSLQLKAGNIESKTIFHNFGKSIQLNNMILNGVFSSQGKLAALDKIKLKAFISTNDELFPYNSFKTEIDLQDSKLNLIIKKDSSTLANASMHLENKYRAGTFSSRIDSIAFFARLLKYERIYGILLINGIFDKKNITTQIVGNSLNYQNMNIDTAIVKLKYSDSTLIIEKAYFTSNDSLISPFNIEGLNTNISYEALIMGEMDNLQGKIKIKTNNTQYKNYKIDSIYTELFYNNNHLIIDSLFFAKNNNSLSFFGNTNISSKTINLENYEHDLILSADYKSSSTTIRLNGKRISIQKIAPFIPNSPKWSGMMNIELNAKIEPLLKNSFVQLKLYAEKLSYHNTTYIDSFYINSEYKEKSLIIDSLKLYSQGEEASANLKFSFADSSQNRYKISHTEGHIEGTDINLKVFNPFITQYSISGFSNNNITWNGSYSKPNFKGFLKIDNGKIVEDNSALLENINIALTVSDTLIKIDSIAFRNKAISAKTVGRFDINNDKVLINVVTSIPGKDIIQISGNTTFDSLSINTSINDFNLALLLPFVPQLQKINGKLNSQIKLNGKINSPDINGRLTIDGLNISHKSIDSEINNGIIAIHFKNDAIIIDTLNLAINKGSISASGDIAFDTLSLPYFNLKSKISDIILNEPTIFNLDISKGDLNYSTKDGKHLLEGNIILGDSKIYRDLKIDDLWGALIAKTKSTYSNDNSNIDFLSLYEEDIKESKIIFPNFLKKTKVNIVFGNSGDLWINNNVADFYIIFNLTLLGEIINPSLTGRINIKEDGKINFLDRVFDIKEGTFEFYDLSKINPTINLSAETEITIQSNDNKHDEVYTITLLLDGPLDQMTTSLTSQPSLEASDIISLLTLGMTYNEIASVSSSTESSDALKKRSGEIASQLISYKMNSYLKKILGDQGNDINFELKGDIFDMDDMRLAVNKRWGKRVTISYSTSMKDFDNRIIRIEYKISNQFSIQGETDQNQESAIDFKYKIRFK